MSSITSIRSSNATVFAATSATYRPTALFVGGTSGIGAGTAGAFARATKGKAHIIICGRNKENAERVISTFPRTSESLYEFVECDATLMSNVVKAATDITSRIGEKGTINYLVLSQGVLNTKGFDPSSEGIDRKLALFFYSRWKFVDELLPCLENAKVQGQEARVLTILNPTLATELDPNDMGLKNNYGFLRVSRQGSTYTNIMVDEYARRYPSISFVHAYPGFVDTPVNNNMPCAMKGVALVLQAVLAVSIDDCGERMTAILARAAYESGGFYVDQHGEQISESKIHSNEKAREVMMAHYNEQVALA